MRRSCGLLFIALAGAGCGGGRNGSGPSREDAGLDGTVPSDAGSDASGGSDAKGPPADGATSNDSGGNAGDAGGNDGEAGGAPPSASVLEYHNHHNRDGYFQDPLLTTTAAAGFKLDTSFTGSVTGSVYASPLYVEHGPNGKGAFYVVTEGTIDPSGAATPSQLYVLDETTGAPVFPPTSYGVAALQSVPGCGNIRPLGITGTPAIDLATNLIVFDAVTGDANGAIATHTIYGVSILDGTTAWSVDVSTLTDPTGLAFTPQTQNQRSAVLIVNGVAYVTYGGHAGDCPTYHLGCRSGRRASRRARARGRGRRRCRGRHLGARRAGERRREHLRLHGKRVPARSRRGSRARASSGWTRARASRATRSNFFAPSGSNWAALDSDDADMSGSGPLVIDAPALTPSQLVAGQGKDGWLYLLDRSNLGGLSAAPGTANVGAMHVSNGNISNGSAWATVGGTTYVVLRPNDSSEGDGCPNGTTGELVGIRLDPTAPQKMTVAWCAESRGNGSAIVTSSDGTSDGLVWVFGAEGDDQLHVFRLSDGSTVSTIPGMTFDAGQVVHHFTTPVAVKGRIFVTADGGLYAFRGP